MNTNIKHLQSLSKSELVNIIISNTQKTNSIKNLLDTINGVSWVYDIQENRFYQVSETSKKILGYKPSEWVDYNSWLSMVHPQDREETALYCAKKTESNEDHLMEYRMLKKNGDFIWVLDIVTLSKDENGTATKLFGFIIDITEKKQVQLELEKEHKFMQTILDSINNPMMIISRDYSVSMMNMARTKDIQGQTFIDNNSPKCYEISHQRDTPCDGTQHACPLHDVLESKKPSTAIHNHKDREGSDRFFELHASPIFDDDNNCTGIIETAVDITNHIHLRNQLQESNQNLTHTANHDFLTGLPNRALFMDRLEQTIKDAKRNHTKAALFFMDLDHFKEINDEYGHETGDKVLQTVAQRFSECIRENDTLSRLGGDEFTLIMKDFKTKEDIIFLANRMVTKIQKPIMINNITLHLSTSIGIGITPTDASTAEELLHLADTSMYGAKNSGKNQFLFHDNI